MKIREMNYVECYLASDVVLKQSEPKLAVKLLMVAREMREDDVATRARITDRIRKIIAFNSLKNFSAVLTEDELNKEVDIYA